MAFKWLLCVTVLIFMKCTEAKKPTVRQETTKQATVRIPLLKPLGMTGPKLNKNLNERPFGQEYIEQYQEIMKASLESFENFEEHEEKRLRRLVGGDDFGMMAEAGGAGRRRVRSGGRLWEQTLVGQRRARSQALRRDKLNAQSVTSHRRHSKPKPNYIHADT